jgi:hypothetical protein
MLEYSARAAMGPLEKPALLRGREVLRAGKPAARVCNPAGGQRFLALGRLRQLKQPPAIAMP